MSTIRPLSPFEEQVIVRKGTEAPNTGLYTHTNVPGAYHCKRCDAALYHSQHKFPSHCGWPSFDDQIKDAIKRVSDKDGQRVEILCAQCDAHLGHVFSGEGFTAKNLRYCVNSVSMRFVPDILPHYRSIVLASGCFWGTEYFLARLSGVVRTRVGYLGGKVAQPTYKQVCTGTTGHVEAVEVLYDPKVVDLQEIGRVFFETHDFSQEDGQGPDLGSQYLSVFFYANEDEKSVAEHLIKELQSQGYKIATSLRPLATFWEAEAYHQLYYEAKGSTPYCHRYRKLFARS